MAGTHLSTPEDLAPYKAYHARRSRERFERREKLRQRYLAAARASIGRLAPEFAPLCAVYLFGSVLRPGQFSRSSDIDVAVLSDDVAVEGRFRRALEEELGRDVDLRPLEGAVARAVEDYGECVYEREIPGPRA